MQNGDKKDLTIEGDNGQLSKMWVKYLARNGAHSVWQQLEVIGYYNEYKLSTAGSGMSPRGANILMGSKRLQGIWLVRKEKEVAILIVNFFKEIDKLPHSFYDSQ